MVPGAADLNEIVQTDAHERRRTPDGEVAVADGELIIVYQRQHGRDRNIDETSSRCLAVSEDRHDIIPELAPGHGRLGRASEGSRRPAYLATGTHSRD